MNKNINYVSFVTIEGSSGFVLCKLDDVV